MTTSENPPLVCVKCGQFLDGTRGPVRRIPEGWVHVRCASGVPG